MMTATLVVNSPILNKYSQASTLFLCTYRHTEKLLPLIPVTFCVTIDLMLLPPLVFPSNETAD
jgi:hypothetical protein